MTRLEKESIWYIWKPHGGRYKNRTLYVSIVKSPDESRHTMFDSDVLSALLAFESLKTGELTMHKGQITKYQFDRNTTQLKNSAIIYCLDKLFLKYKSKWESMRVVKDAKSLLSS